MFGLACEHAWCNLLLLLKILFSFPMTGMHWSWCLVKGKKQQSADSVFFCIWYTKSSTATQTSTYGLWHSSRYTGNNEVSVKASFVPVTSINMLGEVAETHSVKIKTVSEMVFLFYSYCDLKERLHIWTQSWSSFCQSVPTVFQNRNIYK